jgi:uncharacterized protein YbjQ (UPF0145 family)
MARQEELEPLKLPVATTETIPGRTTLRYVGPAFGVIARSMGFAKGFTGSFKALKSGEVKQFTAVLEAARHHAVERLIDTAVAYGTAVVIE